MYIYRESPPLKDRLSTVLCCENFISTRNSTSKAMLVGKKRKQGLALVIL